MPLAGQGVLAIWNGVLPGADADFAEWHVREHIPERVGVPGFLRGRRYAAVEASPPYFNFYETETADVLLSAPYRARLDDPTPWTTRNVSRFTDTSRTVCDVATSLGIGVGAFMETMRLSMPVDTETLNRLLALPGMVGVHLLQGRPAAAGQTAEQRLRGRPDEVVSWVLLLDAIGREPLDLAYAQLALVTERAIYQLQYSLDRAAL